MTYASIITGDSIIIMANGTPHTISSDNRFFKSVKESIKVRNFDEALKYINLSVTLNSYTSSSGISIQDSVVYYNGEALHNVLATKILDMYLEGFDIDPMVAFLENLLKNPAKSAIDELYTFLENAKLPITEDGHLLAYKRVKDDYTDFFTGTFDNTPGTGVPVKMPRNKVCDNRNKACSDGLHFCSLNYLNCFYPKQGKIVIVKINPKDVVSFPSDCSNTKGRCCEYLVIEEYKGSELEHAFDKSVYELSLDQVVDEPKKKSTAKKKETYKKPEIPSLVKAMVGKTYTQDYDSSYPAVFKVLSVGDRCRNDKGHYMPGWFLEIEDTVTMIPEYISSKFVEDNCVPYVDKSSGFDLARNTLNKTFKKLSNSKNKKKGKKKK